MITPEPTESGKVSLGELLRLKRAERPAPEFWARFERDLRAKQLAAIVEKRPWWVALRLPLATRALACWQLQIPLSAAAVLALSVVVVREYRPGTAVIPAAHPEAAVKIAATPGTVTVREVPSALTSVGVIAPAAIVASPPSLQETGISVALVVESSEAVTDTNAPAEQALAIVETDAIIPFVPEENHSLAGVGELPAVEFELVSASDTELGFASGLEIQGEGFSVPWAQNRPEVRSSPTVPVTPREIRRGRILATLVVADNSSYKQQLNPGYAHEVIADTLADENSYTGISRIGMGGDRLTLKF